ncbi:hypothetical protein ALC62_01465 [Cyphomyrmex costatus]|uniref:Uncharacterized protein n=1 Tax=Cyphomyrmex costatus TaxID=456900 RepID=A0A151IP77_9HYME|nr:hypothetical protein ALC62_01465 [Cyphomyrmex costatus]
MLTTKVENVIANCVPCILGNKRAKNQILRVQDKNRRTYNLRRCEPTKYKLNDLIAIKRVQMGPDKKLCAKYLIRLPCPYQIVKVKPNNSYDVKCEVPGEGPMKTSTCVTQHPR